MDADQAASKRGFVKDTNGKLVHTLTKKITVKTIECDIFTIYLKVCLHYTQITFSYVSIISQSS